MSVTLNDMGLEPDKINYLMISMVVAYLPMCFIYPRCCTKLPRKLQFVIACLGNGLAMFFLGPSKLLGLPQEWYIIGIAFPILGFF